MPRHKHLDAMHECFQDEKEMVRSMVVVSCTVCPNRGSRTSNMRCRISIPIPLGQTAKERLRRHPIDVTRLVRIIVRYGRISGTTTLYPVDDDANENNKEDGPESGTERNKHGNAYRMATT